LDEQTFLFNNRKVMDGERFSIAADGIVVSDSHSINSPARLSENNNVLLRQHFNRFIEPVSLGLHFRPNLTYRHFVLRPDRHFGIFSAVFQKHNPAIGLQRLPNPVRHFLGFRNSW
jgi:hypothetical protein